MTTIKDELKSFIFLKDVNIYIAEYIIFGTNHIIAFNEELDCQRKIKEGLMTSFIDNDPHSATFKIDEALTRVQIIDYDPNDYVQFNASIVYEEVVEQEEEISVYVDAYGRVIYGAKILEIDGISDKLSIDKLTRVISDLIMDTSTMINTLLSTYQRRLLDLVYFGTPQYRNKFVIITAKGIEPDQPAIKFNDGEDLENELNQILSTTTHFYNMKNSNDKIFYGLEGLIIISDNPEKYQDLISILSFYYGLDIFQKNYFNKMFMLWDEIKDARHYLNMGDIDPNATTRAKGILSEVSASVVLMNELLQFMKKSVENMNKEWEALDKSDPDIQELIRALAIEDFVNKADVRISDAQLVVSGLTEEIHGVNGIVNSLAEKQMTKMNESLRDSIASMDEVTRASERTGTALTVLEVILSGAIAFDVLTLLSGEYTFSQLSNWISTGDNIYIWIAICVGAFFSIGIGLYLVIKHLEKKSEPNLRVKINIGKPYTKKFEQFINNRKIITRDTFVNESIIEEFTWEEDDKKWLGNEVRIKLRADTENHFIHNILVNIDKPKNINSRQITNIILKYLKDEHVI
ncbi:MAG: hypothetical protein ACTSPQ_10850 [Candidatus Helarchaeota archaeon]